MWQSAGRPRSGTIFEPTYMKNAKYKYKLAVRYVVNQFESRYDVELTDACSGTE